ncbi:hypothetical protein BB560_005842 [Smittium megazygosporum]|uniref:Uncharacterized protein n=1 Tax=Smittium megazygosporum TaxID=133381 RepID=A0A2T9YU07_9FUNG|nr:hypothetical protein BB560_005842 [Smittium megazygosporum]
MSTTDPSAAKPDDFAIGSTSKLDRSGSGDKAASVYLVKHPTMSYAELESTQNVDEISSKFTEIINETANKFTTEAPDAGFTTILSKKTRKMMGHG